MNLWVDIKAEMKCKVLTFSYFQPYLQLSRLHDGPDGNLPQGRGRGCLAGLPTEAGQGATHGGVGPSQRDAHTGGLI